MEEQEAGTSSKRITPGRAAKATKRKLSSDATPRTVKPKLDDTTMSLSLDQLRSELALSETRVNANTQKCFDQLSSRIDGNTDLIRSEREERRRDMDRVQQQIDSILNGAGTNTPMPGLRPRPQNAAKQDDLDNKYQRARRTLLLYPVQGDTPDQIIANLQKFLLESMLVPAGEIQRAHIECVRRFRGSRTSRERQEITVVFADNDTRDFVLSHARNLAGKPNMGVRIDVPHHLLSIKRTFDEYGFILKSEIGGEFKRNVRYDDAIEGLTMDVFYPDTKKWERITHREALEGLAHVKQSRQRPPLPRRQPLVLPARLPSPNRRASSNNTTRPAPSRGAAATPTGSSSEPTGAMDDVWTA